MLSSDMFVMLIQLVTLLVAKHRVSVGSRASWPVRRLFDGGPSLVRLRLVAMKGKCRKSVLRHILGLFRAVPGARAFRRRLATEAVKPGARSQQILANALIVCAGQGTRLAHIAA